jgi:hypothetical protein
VIILSSNSVRIINWEEPATLTGDKSVAHIALLGNLEEK